MKNMRYLLLRQNDHGDIELVGAFETVTEAQKFTNGLERFWLVEALPL